MTERDRPIVYASSRTPGRANDTSLTPRGENVKRITHNDFADLHPSR
jgi:hypothetical protein